MAGRIEDYAIVGDMQSVALICVDGSVEVQTALNLGGHAEEHRRGPRIPWDERQNVPG